MHRHLGVCTFLLIPGVAVCCFLVLPPPQGVLSVSTTSSGCSTLLYQFKTVANGAVTVVDQMALIRQVTDKQQLEEENKVQEF